MRDGIIYDCPSVNCKTPLYTGKCRKDCLEKRNKELGINHQTNADRIRAMSDEELAEWLMGDSWDCHDCPEHERLSDNPLLRNERCDEKCKEHCLDWLKQPVKDGE